MNLLGKLDWSAIPFDQPIIMGASGGVVLVIVLILSWVTLKGYVPYLWREWITSVDHKRIGIMYIILALIMLLRGFADAIMMRAQQAVAAGGAQGYLPPEHFDQNRRSQRVGRKDTCRPSTSTRSSRHMARS